MSDGDMFTIPSACSHTMQNGSIQANVAVDVLHELELFNASQECIEGFKPWICRQLFSSCAKSSLNRECEVFQSLCAEDAPLVMTSPLLSSVCFYSDSSSDSGKCS